MGILDETPEQAARRQQRVGQSGFVDNLMGGMNQMANTAGGPPALTPPSTDGMEPPPQNTEVDTYPGIPGQEGSGLDDAEGTILENMGMGIGAPLIPGGGQGGMGAAVMPEGENWLPFGGLEGKQDFQDTFVTKPNEIHADIMSGAEAEADKAAAVADWYKQRKGQQEQENAVLQQKRLERQQEVQARQAQIEDATQRYSNDLADRGQFWRNPGNIMAAFGAALMTLGSDDHAIGFKLINQAVQQDYAQRKGLADMHLGELNSNLAAYRQIAGDANLGDQLAQAENSRVAALELERIAQQFQGPIAKAKASAIAKNFLMDSQRIKAQVYAQMIYNRERLEQQALANAKVKTGQATNGAGFTTFGGQPVRMAGRGGVGSGGAVGGPAGKVVGTGTSAPQAITSSGGEIMTDAQAEAIDKRYPGASSQILSVRNELVQENLAEIGVDIRIAQPGMRNETIAANINRIYGPKKVAEFNKKMVEFRRDQAKDYQAIAAAVQPISSRMAGYRLLGKDIEVIEQTARQLKVSADDLVGTRYEQVFGAGNVKAINEFMDASEPGTKHEAQARAVADAISRFKQLKAMNVNAYFKATAGGNVTLGEENRLKQFISDGARWASVRAFQKDISTIAAAEARNATAGARSPLVRTLWNIRVGMNDAPLNQPGIAGPAASGNPNGPGNTGKNAFRGKSEVTSVRGKDGAMKDVVKGSPEDPDVIRAIENLRKMSGK